MSSRIQARSCGGMCAPALDNVRNAYHPVDERAGETWFHHLPPRHTLVVLNGGHASHARVLPCRHSRGLVPFHFASHAHADAFISGYDFQNLEPFTLVVIEDAPRAVRSIVWTGTQVDHVLHAPDHTRI